MFFGVLFSLDLERAFHRVNRVAPAPCCTLGQGNGAAIGDNRPIALLGASPACTLVLLRSVFTGTDRKAVVGSLTSFIRMSVLIAFLALLHQIRVSHQRRSHVVAVNQYRWCDFVHFISRD